MPELPELEILRRELDAQVVGRRVVEVMADDAALAEGLVGACIASVERRGKMLVLNFDNERSLVIHLMMVGQLLLSPPFAGEPRDVCLALRFADGAQLSLGQVPLKYVHLLPTADVEGLPAIAKLGVDPLSEGFTLDRLRAILAGRRGALKPLLLDQSLMAGIGNTYADEILFAARLHPKRKAASLNEAEVVRLYESILVILERGIELGGSSEMAFLHLDGARGRSQERFQVKGRKGEPCFICGIPIERIEVGGRGTYLCPQCQE